MHTGRVNRIEDTFILWLNAHCRNQSSSLAHVELLKDVKLTSVCARRTQHDGMFVRNVLRKESRQRLYCNNYHCTYLVVQPGSKQLHCWMYIPFARVNTVKNGLFVRIPRQLNRFLESCPTAEMFSDMPLISKWGEVICCGIVTSSHSSRINRCDHS